MSEKKDSTVCKVLDLPTGSYPVSKSMYRVAKETIGHLITKLLAFIEKIKTMLNQITV